MRKMLFGAVVLALVSAGGLAIVQATQTSHAPSAPAQPIERQPSVHGEMNGLDRRTRFDMLLYSGRLRPTDMAMQEIQLDAIAFTVRPTLK